MNQSLPLKTSLSRIDRMLDSTRDVTLGTLVGIEFQIELM